MAKTVTSIRVDEKLWREAKHYAIDNGLTLTDLIEQALRNEMNQGRKKDE